MREAVDRLVYALINAKRLLSMRFRVDGVTATVLMVEVLQKLGGWLRPNSQRFDEGYGLNTDALENLPPVMCR